VLGILGLDWQEFYSGIANGVQQLVDDPIVDGAKEDLGNFADDPAKRGRN
jgi:hypothetical protein